MATRKKYKIMLSEKYVRKSENGEEWFQFPLNISGQLVAIQTIIPLAPYTEPDLEQVRKEAYENGYENGFVAGHLKAEKSGQSFYEDGYQRGMADANRDGEYNADDGWYVMQKISLLPNPIKTELFGTAETAVILQDNSFKDALDKLTEYEQEKKEQIQVGDEVETPSGLKGYVVNFTDDELVHYVSSEGRFGTMGMSAVSKTGRHFPEIAAVLEKMKES